VGVLVAVFTVAFFFSMLGMGGGQLYTPIFYWLGLDLRTQAVPLALWLSFSSQSAAAMNYWRYGLVQFRTALPILIGLIGGAPVGALIGHHAPQPLILFLFATMTVVALLQVWLRRPSAEAIGSGPGALVFSLVGGAAIGFLAGMIGRGGGSLVVPLLLLLGVDPKRAAATSSFAVCFSSLAGAISHLAISGPSLPVHWLILLTGVVAVGAVTGSRYMAKRLRSRTVRPLFMVVLAGVAAGLYWDVFAA